MTDNTTKIDVFISYSRADSNDANAIASTLRSAGLEVWIDRSSIIPGQDWRSVIVEAIRRASAFAFLVGASGVSASQEREFDEIVAAAEENQRLIIPLLLPDARKTSMPALLKTRQWIDMGDGLDQKMAWQHLISAILSSRASNPIEQEQESANALTAIGDLVGATNHLKRALELSLSAHGDAHPTSIELLTRLAKLQRDQADFSGSLATFERALKAVEAFYGPGSERVGVIFSNIGIVLQSLGRTAEAEAFMRRALNLASDARHDDNVAIDLNNLGHLLQETNRFEEAEQLMRRALFVDESRFGPDHPTVAKDLTNVATLLRARNRLDEAEMLARRALLIYEKNFGPDDPKMGASLNNLGQILKATGRLAEAEPLMRRALAIDEKSYGPVHPNVAGDLNNLAQLFQATNRLAEAEPLMRRAIAIFETRLGPSHPSTKGARDNLAGLEAALGRPSVSGAGSVGGVGSGGAS